MESYIPYVHGWENLDIGMISVLLKLINRFSTILTSFSAVFFLRDKQSDFFNYIEIQRSCTIQNSLIKEQCWRMNSRCKVIVTKTVWCWPNARQMYQWNGPKIDHT